MGRAQAEGGAEGRRALDQEPVVCLRLLAQDLGQDGERVRLKADVRAEDLVGEQLGRAGQGAGGKARPDADSVRRFSTGSQETPRNCQRCARVGLIPKICLVDAWISHLSLSIKAPCSSGYRLAEEAIAANRQLW